MASSSYKILTAKISKLRSRPFGLLLVFSTNASVPI